MGFYAPAQLVQAARRQSVEILPLDVNVSESECTLEQGKAPRLRLGFCLVQGLSSQVAERIEHCRGVRRYRDMEDFNARVLPDRKSLQLLAAADAFSTLAGNRHHAHWQASGIEGSMPLWQHRQQQEAMPLLRTPSEGDNVVADYQSLGLTLRQHPLALLRPELNRLKVMLISELSNLPDTTLVHSAGLVITRQRPGTANNVTFVTLEDDTGYLNLVVWEQLAEARRSVLLRSRLLGVTGRLQKQNGVLHLIATRLEDYSYLLGELTTQSRDFH
jgi:error-prone DNA polymerase